MEKSTTSGNKLRRPQDPRLIAGVCSGVGRYFGIDPNIVRLALAVFTVFGGAGVLVYVLAWLVIPEDGAPSSLAEDLMGKANDNPKVQEAKRKAKEGLSRDKTHV